MPLARITTPLPEYFERLAQDLRARGFDVEAASPGQYFSNAADLEITVKQCSPEEAGKAAAASGKDMCVLLGPDAKTTGIRSIEMIVLQPKAEAAEHARHFVTPAQVIEISSSLISSDEVQPQQTEAVERVDIWPKVKAAAQTSWDEIAKTTAHWMENVTAACHAGWEKTKQAYVPAKEFFSEIGEETRKLGKNTADNLTAFVRRAKKNGADQDEQLVPSMFDFSEELSSDAPPTTGEDKPVIEMPKRKAVLVDKRFGKAALVAGAAAVAVLLTVSVMRRPHQLPAVVNEAPVAKAAETAPVALKPSAMVEHNGAKSAVHLASAKQVIHTSEASDTVVRYGNRPVKQKPADSHPGIKRYSDLD
ncbi:MAG TPA: hypothetical protein VH088_22205 [Terriglobales bacterium]|jgi:hypothetical protein|nr:hypothetical protein [Terriglobales bacterium]